MRKFLSFSIITTLLILSFSNYVAYSTDFEIDSIVDKQGIENNKYESEMLAINSVLKNADPIKENLEYLKANIKGLIALEQIKFGIPFRVMDADDDFIIKWACKQDITNFINESEYYWEIPILFQQDNTQKFTNLACKVKKSKDTNKWEFDEIVKELSSGDLEFCSNSKKLTEFFKENGITKANEFLNILVERMHINFLYIKSIDQELFIPLTGGINDLLLGLKHMSVYKRDDEILSAVSLRLKSEIENGIHVTGYVENDLPLIFINKKHIDFDVDPVIGNDRILIPLRKISESLNAQVDWNEETKTVTLVKDNNKVELTIGDNVVYKNEMPITLDVPAKVVNDRTLVPIRFISEAFGATVDYNENANIVIINSK